MARPTTDQRQFVFGPGTAFATLTTFTDGTTPSQPQPRQFDVQQEVSLDFTMTAKPLFGQLIFPVAVGLGEGKVEGKIKMARFSPGLLNDTVFGQPSTISAGSIGITQFPVAGVIPSTPFQITPAVPGGGTYLSDLGVYFGDSGEQLTRVTSPSASGQYSVNVGTGQYTFDSVDAAAPVLMFFRYTIAGSGNAGGATIQVNNLVQGAVAISSFDYQGQYAGRLIGVHLPNIVTNKFSLPTKEQDWIIGEINFQAFANASNIVAYLYLSENLQ